MRLRVLDTKSGLEEVPFIARREARALSGLRGARAAPHATGSSGRICSSSRTPRLVRRRVPVPGACSTMPTSTESPVEMSRFGRSASTTAASASRKRRQPQKSLTRLAAGPRSAG